MSEREFPIQAELSTGEWGKQPECSIPWWLAEIAYVEYRRLFGSRQSLERLAERGGFGRAELVHLLRAAGGHTRYPDFKKPVKKS